jgi:rubrerythrin
MFTASELFDLAIQIEVNGERFYRHAMRTVKRDSVRDLLGWLADQELLHKSAFAEIKERITHGTKPDLSFPSLSQQALSRAMGRHAFSLDELQIDSTQDEEEMLQAAVLFEEDTILFFEFIASFVSDPVAFSLLEKIRAEEFNHKRLLVEKLARI